ncbi:MAG: TerB family tellurite resistance protein [Thiolinea sp.]
MKTLFQWLGIETADSTPAAPDTNLAAAALMVEIMAADDELDEVETSRIKQLLVSVLQLPEHEVGELFAAARQTQREAHDLFHLTSVINEHYQPEQKYALLKALWQVAYADGHLDRYEEHMIRKLADLLYLTHTQFIQAKLEAEAEAQAR